MLVSAPCGFSGCIMPAMASSGRGSESLNAQLLVEELRRSEMELRQILDIAPQHIVVCGPNGERLYANRVSYLRDIAVTSSNGEEKTYMESAPFRDFLCARIHSMHGVARAPYGARMG